MNGHENLFEVHKRKHRVDIEKHSFEIEREETGEQEEKVLTTSNLFQKNLKKFVRSSLFSIFIYGVTET